jgi:hypothetical protein
MTETVVDPQVATDAQPVVVDYWGTDETHKHYLPDGVQYFEFQIMNEGAKVRFQKLTNQDLIVGRDQSARVKVSPEAERHTLIETSVVGWHLFKLVNGHPEPVGYSPQMLKKWLEVAPPKVVEELEYAIRMANPWMQSEMTVEEIDKEIDRLHDVRKQVIEREAGEAASATK